MKRNGYPRIRPAKKGAGSVEEGIEFLKNYDIVVHPRCKHTIDELTFYSYKTDPRTDEIMPVLDDKKNHVIDALRYAVETLRSKTKTAGVW
jgi:phage terminase large subunit